MFYESECWLIKKHVQKMTLAEIKMLCWTYGYTLRDKDKIWVCW